MLHGKMVVDFNKLINFKRFKLSLFLIVKWLEYIY